MNSRNKKRKSAANEEASASAMEIDSSSNLISKENNKKSDEGNISPPSAKKKRTAPAKKSDANDATMRDKDEKVFKSEQTRQKKEQDVLRRIALDYEKSTSKDEKTDNPILTTKSSTTKSQDDPAIAEIFNGKITHLTWGCPKKFHLCKILNDYVQNKTVDDFKNAIDTIIKYSDTNTAILSIFYDVDEEFICKFTIGKKETLRSPLYYILINSLWNHLDYIFKKIDNHSTYSNKSFAVILRNPTISVNAIQELTKRFPEIIQNAEFTIGLEDNNSEDLNSILFHMSAKYTYDRSIFNRVVYEKLNYLLPFLKEEQLLKLISQVFSYKLNTTTGEEKIDDKMILTMKNFFIATQKILNGYKKEDILINLSELMKQLIGSSHHIEARQFLLVYLNKDYIIPLLKKIISDHNHSHISVIKFFLYVIACTSTLKYDNDTEGLLTLAHNIFYFLCCETKWALNNNFNLPNIYKPTKSRHKSEIEIEETSRKKKDKEVNFFDYFIEYRILMLKEFKLDIFKNTFGTFKETAKFQEKLSVETQIAFVEAEERSYRRKQAENPEDVKNVAINPVPLFPQDHKLMYGNRYRISFLSPHQNFCNYLELLRKKNSAHTISSVDTIMQGFLHGQITQTIKNDSPEAFSKTLSTLWSLYTNKEIYDTFAGQIKDNSQLEKIQSSTNLSHYNDYIFKLNSLIVEDKKNHTLPNDLSLENIIRIVHDNIVSCYQVITYDKSKLSTYLKLFFSTIESAIQDGGSTQNIIERLINYLLYFISSSSYININNQYLTAFYISKENLHNQINFYYSNRFVELNDTEKAQILMQMMMTKEGDFCYLPTDFLLQYKNQFYQLPSILESLQKKRLEKTDIDNYFPQSDEKQIMQAPKNKVKIDPYHSLITSYTYNRIAYKLHQWNNNCHTKHYAIKINPYVETHGYTCQQRPEKCNHFFTAVTDQLANCESTVGYEYAEYNVNRVFSAIQDELEKHYFSYYRSITAEHFIAHFNPTPTNKTNYEFVNEELQTNSWFDQIIIEALCRAFSINVFLVTSQKALLFKHPTPISTIYLGYDETPSFYVSLLPTSPNTLPLDQLISSSSISEQPVSNINADEKLNVSIQALQQHGGLFASTKNNAASAAAAAEPLAAPPSTTPANTGVAPMNLN